MEEVAPQIKRSGAWHHTVFQCEDLDLINLWKDDDLYTFSMLHFLGIFCYNNDCDESDQIKVSVECNSSILLLLKRNYIFLINYLQPIVKYVSF